MVPGRLKAASSPTPRAVCVIVIVTYHVGACPATVGSCRRFHAIGQAPHTGSFRPYAVQRAPYVALGPYYVMTVVGDVTTRSHHLHARQIS